MKFNPEVIRIRLNPEQAVLNCNCYSAGKSGWSNPFPPLGQPAEFACLKDFAKGLGLAWPVGGSAFSS